MTHTVHPYSHRLGILRDWKSRWFFPRVGYKYALRGDILIRQYLDKKLKGFYVADVEIERSEKSLRIILSSSRPGMTDLDEESGGKKGATVSSGGGAGGGGGGEDSSSVIAGSGRGSRGSEVDTSSPEQKSEGKKEKSAAEEDKSGKGRGVLYQEGQEEEAIGGSQFNWMRLIIMILILIAVVFMAFEIYKSIKLSRK